MDCKKALADAGGDPDKAVDVLRKKGVAAAEKRAGREATEGIIQTYVHHDSKKACMIEINCETDFVARTDDFVGFTRDLALHVVANRPQFLSQEDVPEDVVARERDIFAEQARTSGKPDKVIEKITEGRIKKFYGEICLLDQPFVKDDSKTVQELIKELAGKLGENIQVRRFALFEVGGAV